MVKRRVEKWIDKNISGVGFDALDNSYWNDDSRIIDFINYFHPSEDLSHVPFVLYSQLVHYIVGMALYYKKDYQYFYDKCLEVSRLASLGDYVREVYEDELIDSIDWDNLKEIFDKID